MESECDDTCVLHPFSMSPVQPHCWDVLSRRTLTCASPGNMMCFGDGGFGISHAVRHGCVPPNALEQPIVATCILAGVTVIISETTWMEVRFGPLPVFYCPKREKWAMAGRGHSPQILREPAQVRLWSPTGNGWNPYSVPKPPLNTENILAVWHCQANGQLR